MSDSKNIMFSRILQENYLGAFIVSLCFSSFLPFYSFSARLLSFVVTFVILSLLALVRALLRAYSEIEDKNEHLSERLRHEVLENEKFRQKVSSGRFILPQELEKYDNVIPIHHRSHRVRKVSHK